MPNHPNRGPKGPFVELADIFGARLNATRAPAPLMTQRQAGELIYATERTWQDWEAGRRRMPYAAMQLFLLKTRQITLDDVLMDNASVRGEPQGESRST